MSTERDVYHAELRKLGHGLPIYEPDPAGEYDKVRVGDVGYVDRFGFFHRIFNAFLPRDDPINVQYGTPGNFEPLAGRSTAIFRRNPLPAGAMHSAYVRMLGGDFGISGSCVPANASIKFTVSNQQGAALIIKHPAFREDTFSEKDLKDYMIRHYHTWIAFFRNDLGCDITLSDIVLVTGCDLTTDWATATFTERTTQCEIEFKAGDPAFGPSGSSAFWGTWQSSIHVPHRCGPCPVRPPVTSTAIEDIPSPGCSDEGPNYNQCIFLRGYRVRERKLLAPRVIKAAAEPQNLDMDRDGDAGVEAILSSLESLRSVLESESDEGDIETSENRGFSSPDKAHSIYTILLDHVLKETNADVAIINDDDVFNVIKRIEINAGELIDYSSLQANKIYATTYVDAVTRENVGIIVDGLPPRYSSNEWTWSDVSESVGRDTEENTISNQGGGKSIKSKSRSGQLDKPVIVDTTANLSKALFPPNHSSASAAMTSPVTVPCQYRTGKTLGSGTYAVVKEAVHVKTGKYYACKVINKKLMEGRKYMVRNEIAVLKRVSKGHNNIVTLHNYFETAHNLYLCFDLCTGGELFDRICAKGNYYEADAAGLVRTILGAVEYIHGCGIVHRDLKPENLLFRTKAEDADIMIADFGLSRIMDEDKLQLLTEICGTPGYMAPEIFRKTGHGKPVDVWAMGVITYFLLCGYTPFDRDSQEQEMQAILKGDYAFEPEEYWVNVSETARDFVRACLTQDPAKRPSAKEAMEHRWLASDTPHFVADPESPTGGPKDLLPTIQKGFNARKTFRKAVLSMMAMRRMSILTHEGAAKLSPRAQELAANINQYIDDAQRESVDDTKSVVHHGGGGGDSNTSSDSTPLASPNKEKPASAPIDTDGPPLQPKLDNVPSLGPSIAQLKKTSLDDKK